MASLHSFYRYIRIDFHSHHGSEFYCPVSLPSSTASPISKKAGRYEQPLIPVHALPRKPDVESLSSIPTAVGAAVEPLLVMQTSNPPAEPSPETQHAKTNADLQPPGDTTAPVQEPTSTPQDTRSDTSSTPLVNAESVLNTATDPPQPPPHPTSSPPSNQRQLYRWIH